MPTTTQIMSSQSTLKKYASNNGYSMSGICSSQLCILERILDLESKDREHYIAK
jgi:hypothetical protein